MKCDILHDPILGTVFVCSSGRRREAGPEAPPQVELPLQGGTAAEPQTALVARLIACVGRELRKRRTLYPRWVAQGRISDQTAEHGIAEMVLVEQTLRTAATGGSLPGRHVFDRMVGTVAREIDRRRRVYPRMIAEQRMTEAAARTELTEMGDVLTWLQRTRWEVGR